MNNQPNYEGVQCNGNTFWKFHSTSSKLVLIALMSLFLLTTVPLYGPFSAYPLLASLARNSSDDNVTDSVVNTKTCDIFSGEWVPTDEEPSYTNNTCGAIYSHQNCMKNGRPDTGFLRWRWRPDGCEMPGFDPKEFLALVRDKTMAFVGDSIGRNQMQSLICLLSTVEQPMDVSVSPDIQFQRWKFPGSNFTAAMFWSPNLVKGRAYSDPTGATVNDTGLFSVFLDEFDRNWTTQLDDVDVLVLSAGNWFYRPLVFHENGTLTGCNRCALPNVTDVGMFYGYRRALRTAFRAVKEAKGFKGVTILRTFSPPHYENGGWNDGGHCRRTRPYGPEARLEGLSVEMYASQLEEFRAAAGVGRRLRLLDVTRAALLRPDGHPGQYGQWPGENKTFYTDCVHWCLPGPIDTWNAFLLATLKSDRLEADGQKLFVR